MSITLNGIASHCFSLASVTLRFLLFFTRSTKQSSVAGGVKEKSWSSNSTSYFPWMALDSLVGIPSTMHLANLSVTKLKTSGFDTGEGESLLPPLDEREGLPRGSDPMLRCCLVIHGD